MNRYLAKLHALKIEKQAPLGTVKTAKTYLDTGFGSFGSSNGSPFSENEGVPVSENASSGNHQNLQNPYARVLAVLDGLCPDHVEHDRWRQAVEDGRRFLAAWGAQAQALGWTERDLFGLHAPPENSHPSYRRLSRYDATGLIWLLQGRPVVALTEVTAAIQHPTGNATIYRRLNKPALGPVGDSLDDFE